MRYYDELMNIVDRGVNVEAERAIYTRLGVDAGLQ